MGCARVGQKCHTQHQFYIIFCFSDTTFYVAVKLLQPWTFNRSWKGALYGYQIYQSVIFYKFSDCKSQKRDLINLKDKNFQRGISIYIENEDQYSGCNIYIVQCVKR